MGRFRIEVHGRGGKLKEVRERVRDPQLGLLERLPDGRWEPVVPEWTKAEVMEALGRGDLPRVKRLIKDNPSYWLRQEVYQKAPPELKARIIVDATLGTEPDTPAPITEPDQNDLWG